LFIIEHLNFNLAIAGKILASSIVTLIIVLIAQLFHQKK
jgi:hypothetical protein